MVKSFTIMGNWLYFQVGNGTKLNINEDSWMGVKGKFLLSLGLVEVLPNQVFFSSKICSLSIEQISMHTRLGDIRKC